MAIKAEPTKSVSKNGLISIGQTAALLGVSIDTVRRWDKAGLIHSIRPDGKNRYFDLKSLEKQKLSRPLKISEAAEKLSISQSTLRRLEKKGIIKPERNQYGERLYSQNTIQSMMSSPGATFEAVSNPGVMEFPSFRPITAPAENQGSDNPPRRRGLSIFDKNYGDLVFSWFIATLTILSGISQLLIPTYIQKIGYKPYIGVMQLIQTLLIVFGATFILSKLAGKSFKVLHNISVAQKLDIMDMSPDGKWGFVTSREAKALLVLDLANHKQVEAIPLGGDPHGVAFLK